MPLLAKQWRFIELPSTQCSAQVWAFDLDFLRGWESPVGQ
jgi:hypothetical protein